LTRVGRTDADSELKNAYVQAVSSGPGRDRTCDLGIKVRLNELQRTASDGNVLQRGGIAFATSCSQMQVTETSLYAHPHAQVVVYVRSRLRKPAPTAKREALEGARAPSRISFLSLAHATRGRWSRTEAAP